MKPWLRSLFLAFLLLVSYCNKIQGQVNATQYQVKAVFLYNFTQFVDWPAETFANSGTPFIIGVYGPNEFGAYLEEAVRNETVKGHAIKLMALSSPTDFRRCQLIYVHKSKVQELATMLPQLKGQSILTVSDAENFCKTGGMIGFTNDGRKIRLQINVDEANSGNLKISSKLLRLAEIVSAKQ